MASTAGEACVAELREVRGVLTAQYCCLDMRAIESVSFASSDFKLRMCA
jgi:hypothetical protein